MKAMMQRITLLLMVAVLLAVSAAGVSPATGANQDPGMNISSVGDASVSAAQSSGSENVTAEQEVVSLPLIGSVNLSIMPTYVTTSIIAFIDGFNPCSLWLITFLLGIVIYSNSRKKILAVGGTFLLVTGVAYALFMVGLLNVFMYIGYLDWIQIIVATIALIFAAVNIKDYFWYKKGISFTIPDKYKPRIFKNMRNVMKKENTLSSMIIGTSILALGVVLVELPCTAGFPLIWTNMMAQQQIQGITFVMHLLLYMIIYLLIEIVIIVIAIIMMKATRFQEKHGRILKMVGGMIMLALAIVMLVNPDLMNQISTTVLIFGGAIAVSLLVIWIHKKILPVLGIHIGTEKLDGELRKSKKRTGPRKVKEKSNVESGKHEKKDINENDTESDNEGDKT